MGNLSTSSKPDRIKLLGSYYTPEILRSWLIDRGLEELKDFKPLSELKVLDPACGDGRFLTDLINRGLKPCNLYGIEVDYIAYNTAKRELPSAVKLNLCHGNPTLRLSPERLVKGLQVEEFEKLRELRMALRNTSDRQKILGMRRTFNTALRELYDKLFINLELESIKLSDLTEDLRGFLKPIQPELEFPELFYIEEGKLKSDIDLIIGNPPWGKPKNLLPPALRKLLYKHFKANFKYIRGNLSYWNVFLELSFELLRPGGILAFILPLSFLGDKVSYLLRRQLLHDRGQLLDLWDIPLKMTGELFEDVVFEATAIIIRKSVHFDTRKSLMKLWKVPGNTVLSRNSSPTETREMLTSYTVSPDQVISGKWYRFPLSYELTPESIDLLNELRSSHGKLGDIVRRASVGKFDETLDRDKYSTVNSSGIILLRGANVKPYILDLRRTWWVNSDASSKLEELPKILIIGRQMVHRAQRRKLHFVLLEPQKVIERFNLKGIAFTNGIRLIELSDTRYYALILILLNSKLYNWLFRLYSRTYNVKPYELFELPLPELTGTLLTSAELLLKRLDRALLSRTSIDKFMSEADRLVYQAFKLSDKQIGIIESVF